ncbi:glycoside hydrolase family 3 N-terminal domain-containing protein [Patulibacter minatonensis]|uniref:glycoside hydrolase family 3 N-terminal domain-containing protein n=1 Tax=Patulibacter minatonensis TaxID=298163 RepID=UPI0004B5879C|nr:glycoside hydrolase family 3 N-terminal domain-containing protein [Patulibacter minatonensis]
MRRRIRRPPGEELAARRRRAVLFGVVGFVLFVIVLRAVACGGDDEKAAKKAPETATQRLTRSLSSTQLVGQTIVSPFRNAGPGEIPPAIRSAIRAGRIGGVILFSENASTVADVRRLTDRLQRITRPGALNGVPLLVMTDQEGGQVRRITDAPPRTSARAQGAAGVGVIQQQARASATALCRAGVNVTLGPVVDSGTGVLATQERLFAADAPTVARSSRAFINGAHESGIAVTAKHFPGLGRAQADTDETRVRVDASLDVLRSQDEVPFRTAIGAGTDLVMLSSAIYPALSPAPAVLSPPVVQNELRGRLGFKGVTISDDLEAGAFAGASSPAQVARAASQAGVDLLLYGTTTDAALAASRALTADLRDGRLQLNALRTSVVRSLDLRARLARSCRPAG